MIPYDLTSHLTKRACTPRETEGLQGPRRAPGQGARHRPCGARSADSELAPRAAEAAPQRAGHASAPRLGGAGICEVALPTAAPPQVSARPSCSWWTGEERPLPWTKQTRPRHTGPPGAAGSGAWAPERAVGCHRPRASRTSEGRPVTLERLAKCPRSLGASPSCRPPGGRRFARTPRPPAPTAPGAGPRCPPASHGTHLGSPLCPGT